jgi:hypothetical protein
MNKGEKRPPPPTNVGEDAGKNKPSYSAGKKVS